MLLRNANQTIVASLGAVDRRTQHLLVLMRRIGNRIAIRIADATVSDEAKTTLGSDPIDTPEVDIVFQLGKPLVSCKYCPSVPAVNKPVVLLAV